MQIHKQWKAPLMLMAVVLTAGCLTDETTHTLYLEPQGEVTWTILQENIRSDGDTRAKRLAEEAEFLEQVRHNEHAAAELLADLAPSSLETLPIRDERPFAIATTARFRSIESFLQRIFDDGASAARVELEITETEGRLTVTCPLYLNQPDQHYSCEPLHDLFTEATLWLTEGKFSDSQGFVLARSEMAASLPPLDEFDLQREGDEIVYELSWQMPEVKAGR